jgi:hypothetical protein
MPTFRSALSAQARDALFLFSFAYFSGTSKRGQRYVERVGDAKTTRFKTPRRVLRWGQMEGGKIIPKIRERAKFGRAGCAKANWHLADQSPLVTRLPAPAR